MRMRKANPMDWETEPFPSQSSTVLMERIFSNQEMELIQRGIIPEQMEDKWFIYWKDDELFFHRSWTGCCIYVARFESLNGSWKMIDVKVNRDPEQYSETSDDRDKEMISYLLDVLLLHRDAKFPTDEPTPLKSALKNWSEVGRAMVGQYPLNEENAEQKAPVDADNSLREEK